MSEQAYQVYRVDGEHDEPLATGVFAYKTFESAHKVAERFTESRFHDGRYVAKPAGQNFYELRGLKHL